jgi:hypothetical protein
VSTDLAEAARALYQPGVNGHGIKAVAKQLGISANSVRRYVDPAYAERQRRLSREAKQRRTGICRECGGETRYNGHRVNGPSSLCSTCLHRLQHEAKLWTRETVIAAIQEWEQEHGRPPSANDWLHSDPEQHWPNRGSVYRSGNHPGSPFQNWADAIEAAGFPRPRMTFHGRKGELVWTKERTLEAIRVWAVEHGRVPSCLDWDRRADDRPTSGWVQQLFGRWNIALALAGLTPRPKAWPKPKSEEAP